MTSQLATPESRALFRQFALAVKRREFGPVELGDLLQLAIHLDSRSDRVSVLRFGMRLAHRSGQDDAEIIASLRSEYKAAAMEHGLSAGGEKFLSWYRRYGGTSDSLRVDGFRSLEYEGTIDQLAKQAFEGDWDYSFIQTAGVLECRVGDERVFAKAQTGWSPFIGTMLAQVLEGSFALQNGVWGCAGKTHVGVPGGDHNDDAIGVCGGEGTGFLLAVADGTGDSRFGSRASAIALQGLLDAWCAGVTLESGVKLAASKLRADNCAHALDGACTLAACVLYDDHTELVAVGDAFFVCVGADGHVHKSVFDKEGRSVLGGEPLGLTITSSGRLVDNLNHRSRVDVIRVDRAHRVLLGSDGACVPGLDESLNELTEMLDRAGSPLDIAEGLVAGAQDRSRTTGAYDNISAVVALTRVQGGLRDG